MTNSILYKTDKGREEIATRKYSLAPRLRSLLVIIDGKRDLTDWLNKVPALGLKNENIKKLIENGFVSIVKEADHENEQTPQHSLPIAQDTKSALTTNNVIPAKPIQPQPPPISNTTPPPISVEQYKALHSFFNETIKSTLGLRGFTMQLKVERASYIEDFKELCQPYIDAVEKTRGTKIARSLTIRLDELLNFEK